MYRCQKCLTSFVFPTPSDQELATFYSNYHLSDEEGGMYDSLEGRMQADFPTKVKLVQGELPGGKGRVLDVDRKSVV